jgi:hypothetical protein
LLQSKPISRKNNKEKIMLGWQKILLSLSMALGCGIVQSATAPAIPAPLEPWRAWVLDKHRDLACPPHYASLGERVCRWPGKLLIEANDQGANFAQDWRMYGEGWVDLPGDQRYWPQEVRVNDRTVAVIERDSRPAIWLAAGEYHVQGNIRWDSLPPRLALPEDSGLLGLTLDGKPVTLPSVDERGGLLFGENRAPETVADSLSVQVFRQLQDNIPLQMETVVRFRVAGRDRELVLGQLLLDGWVPLALDTPLPARIEPDGRLRVQLRAGEWEVHLRARAEGQPTVLASKKMDASTHTSNHENSWPDDEIWSLQDNRSLRQITAAGPASIDPSQIDMPPEWRQLPAWLLHAGDQLTITEHQRGDALVAGAATGEALAMTRDLWLDFDGKGITSRDVVNGVLKQATRFSTAAGQQLGRAEVNGEPQLITRLDSQSGQTVAGIELRPGPLDLLAMSRLEQPYKLSKALLVSGWQRDFNRVSATLHLPPGWMVLHAAGADSAQGSWLARWNLWAIFLVLIVSAASGRLLGGAVGLLACCTLGLTYHTPNAPVFLWLAALVGVALLRVLPEGRVRRWLSLYNGAVFVLLAFVLLNFAVEQARRSLYPQLELGSHMTIQQPSQVTGRTAASPASAEPAQEMLMKRENMAYDMASAVSSVPERKLKTGYDASAKVQTGPGEPAWQWQRVALGWSGPVVQGQTLHLYLLSPDWHRVWNFVSVLLVFAFAAKLLRAAYPAFDMGRLFAKGLSAKALVPVALLLCLLLMPGAPVFAQQSQPQGSFPDAALLTELEQRLTRSPDCDPQCASFNRGVLQVDASNLRLDLQIDAQETVAVPLPVMRNQWQPRTVLVDGEASDSLRRDSTGQLWIVLAAGTHRVLLEGSVLAGSGNTDSIQLPFEMPVHNLVVEANGWQVSGVTNGQVAGRSVQLTRDKQSAQGGVVAGEDAAPQLLPDQPKPFLLVTRTLVLGLDWQVQTSVLRLAPAVGAITMPVTVLPGEAVLTPGINVKDGRVQVVMSANSRYFSWTSSFKQNSAITLTAAPSAPWVEHWLFDIAPIWHVDFSGLNPVKQDMQTGQLPRWQPWPGESLTATVTRPEAVSGSTRTIESVSMDYRPGARSSETTLSLQVRSSQGGEFPLTLPAASQLQRVTIDGVEQSNPAQGALLRMPLRPGNQMLVVNWRQDETSGWRTVTPQPKIDEPLSNIELKLSLPAGRWLLAVGGPAMGPALLFWGVLVVIVLVAIGLGRSRIVPVATWQWLLLGIGMSTVNSAGSILVVLWFIAMSRRRTMNTGSWGRQHLNLVQLGLAFLTLLALGNLISTIPMSLLSTPDMQVVGNQSTASQLLWYQDRTLQGLPTAWAISLPMWVYRAVMLVWSLWLVFALMAWCRWGWECFSASEVWRAPTPVNKPQPELAQPEPPQPEVKQ